MKEKKKKHRDMRLLWPEAQSQAPSTCFWRSFKSGHDSFVLGRAFTRRATIIQKEAEYPSSPDDAPINIHLVTFLQLSIHAKTEDVFSRFRVRMRVPCASSVYAFLKCVQIKSRGDRRERRRVCNDTIRLPMTFRVSSASTGVSRCKGLPPTFASTDISRAWKSHRRADEATRPPGCNFYQMTLHTQRIC